MLLLRQPTADDIHGYLTQQKLESFSYNDVGATRDAGVPGGYNVHRHVIELGHGPRIFDKACEAIRGWKMFPKQMASLYWPSITPEVGHEVVVGFRTGPLWSLNPCRIVYVMDEQEADSAEKIARFGFAYGTLPGHLEKGEERFLVSWNRDTDVVHYEIFCFSATQHPLAWIGYPLVLYQQARFRRLSGLAIQDFIASTDSLGHPSALRTKMPQTS